MKTFTVSAVAFYFFYVLNGLMAPGQAARPAQGACQDAVSVETGAKAASAGSCKTHMLAVR
ncbi:hypothetical protein SAMN05216552_100436 [Pseudoduganella namucuonensis]|uniref:Uncharacterized protein n=1 Tax=Pseudoduganella namucuonensis TaxID=1035707 RepID=A0A1I7GR04_9BURK|nr:hypothetical protein SAMN05216552_100436 [Pseudoduganella namucuonensis]